MRTRANTSWSRDIRRLHNFALIRTRQLSAWRSFYCTAFNSLCSSSTDSMLVLFLITPSSSSACAHDATLCDDYRSSHIDNYRYKHMNMVVEYRRQEQHLFVCSFGTRSIFIGGQVGSITAPTGSGRSVQIVLMTLYGILEKRR